MKNHPLLLIAASVGLAGLVVGCKKSATETAPPAAMDHTHSATGDAMNHAADNTGDALNRAADNTGDALKHAADKTGDAAKTAAGKTGDALQSAAEATKSAAKTTGQKVGAAVEAMTPSTVGNVQDTFADVTNDALTRNGLDNLAGQLVNADQDRIKAYVNNEDNLADLNAKVGQIRRDWKAKYGNDFKMGDGDKILSNLKLSDMTSDNGVNKAVATLPAGDNLPQVKLNLVRESGTWKIDLPDSVTGASLKASLIKHLDMVEATKDQWPADQNEAYKIVARHVLMGVSESGQ